MKEIIVCFVGGGIVGYMIAKFMRLRILAQKKRKLDFFLGNIETHVKNVLGKTEEEKNDK